MTGETYKFSSKMAEKTYVFDGGQGNFDPNLFAALNNGGFGGFGGNSFWGILLIALLFGRDGFGRGGYNMDYIGSQLTSAAQGNANAISNLSTQLNCTNSQIQSAIAAVQGSIQQVANANNMNSMQVINSIQAGNTAIANQISQCCCDNKLLFTQQNYENRINNTEQTAILGGKIDQQTTLLNDKFCQLEMREMQHAIDNLREEKATLKGVIDNANQTAQISAMIAPLKSDIDTIKCKLPQTYNVPYQPFTAIPNCVAYGMGLYGAGYGLNPGGSIWP